MKRRNFLAMLLAIPVVGKWFKAQNESADSGFDHWVITRKNGTTTHYLNGQIVDAKIYDHALSPEAIRVLYSGSVTRYKADSGPAL